MKKIVMLTPLVILIVIVLAVHASKDNQPVSQKPNTKPDVVQVDGQPSPGVHSDYITECTPKDPGITGDETIEERHAKQDLQNKQQQEIVDVARQMEAMNDQPQGPELTKLNAHYYALLEKYSDCTTRKI